MYCQFRFNTLDEFKSNMDNYINNNFEKWYIVDLTKPNLIMTILGEYNFEDWNKENKISTKEKLIERVSRYIIRRNG